MANEEAGTPAPADPTLGGRSIDAPLAVKAAWQAAGSADVAVPEMGPDPAADDPFPDAPPVDGPDDPPEAGIDNPGPLDDLPDPPSEDPLTGGALPPSTRPAAGLATALLGAPPAAAGPRTARPVAATEGEPGWARHNWVPAGPRNVGGRVRSLLVDPADPQTMYAGAAAGGVYRSKDGGETWDALWHERPALAVGAMGLCPAHPETIYVATGEVQSEDVLVNGDGIHVSRDGGDTWDQGLTVAPPGTLPNLGFKFDAVAVHPTTATTCWAVGLAGVFRTRDGGVTWSQFAAGTYFSDAVYSSAAGANGPYLFLVPALSRAGEVQVLRLDLAADADDPTVRAALDAVTGAANVSTVAAAPATRPDILPGRGKVAVCAAHPDRAYLRSATETGGHRGMFRCDNANTAGAATALTWTPMADHPIWATAAQGTYDLCVAVHPVDPAIVVTGMTELHLTRNATAAPTGAPAVVPATWLRSMAWDLSARDRAHHADQHSITFADIPPAAPGPLPGVFDALWVTNDGGVTRSTEWRTGAEWPGTGNGALQFTTLEAVPANAIGWLKRSHGIDATMMYSVSQHPTIPSVAAIGLQDNGVYLTAGSETWDYLQGGDGGFVAFEPHDPYSMIVTDWGGVDELRFPGLTSDLLGAQVGHPVALGRRPLNIGFAAIDGPAFVADTAHHPRDPRRVLHTRQNRLYGTLTSDDTWEPLAVGEALDIWHVNAAAARATLEVRPTRAAVVLGLCPQFADGTGARARPLFDLQRPVPPVAAVRCRQPGPYALQAGDRLEFVVDGTARVVTFAADPTIADLAHASASEVAAFIRAHGGPVTAGVALLPVARGVRITTVATGAAATLTLGGTALAVLFAGFPRPLPAMGVGARTYRGSAGQSAVVTLSPYAQPLTVPDPAGPRVLSVTVGTQPSVDVALDATTLSDPSNPRPGELLLALRARLDPAVVAITPESGLRFLRVRSRTSASFTLTGTAAARLRLPSPASRFAALALVPNALFAFDLRPDAAGPLRLVFDDATTPHFSIVFTPGGGIADLATVTVEELRRVIAARLSAVPGTPLRCDIADPVRSFTSQAHDIRFSASAPDTVWTGSTDGSVHHSIDGGRTWLDPPADQLDRLRARSSGVGAIAIHPTRPTTVYVGYTDAAARTATPGTLWKTEDDGATWVRREDGLRDGAGRFVGVNAIEIDPADPQIVYAATEAGVFRSGDGGGTWSPFSEGLPAARIRDLTFEPTTRTLRAGAWGRGTFTRHVGDRPPRDVGLYVRTHLMDDGQRPAARDEDEYARTPAAVRLSESPDIKIAQLRPGFLGADVTRLDGVEFDIDLVDEAPAVGGGFVYVQVHNRGWAVPHQVRMVLLWAPVIDEPPPLPATFWTALAAGPVTGTQGDWQVAADTVAPDPPTTAFSDASRPRVVEVAVTWPPDVATHRTIGLLALVASAEDALTSTERDVFALVQTEAKAAYRQVPARALLLGLRATAATTFTLADGATSPGVLAALGLPATPALADATGGAGPFALPAGPSAAQLTLAAGARTATITFRVGDPMLANLAHVQLAELVAVLERDIVAAGLPVAVWTVGWVQGGVPHHNSPILHGNAGAIITLGGTARPLLGLPAGPAAELQGPFVPGPPYDLRPIPHGAPGAVPVTLTLSVTQTVTLTLREGPNDLPSAAGAGAFDVARVLDRQLAETGAPARALVGSAVLRVRAAGGLDRVRAAEIALSPVQVVDVPGRLLLFTGPAAAGLPVLPVGAPVFLYVRVGNDGELSQPGARVRAFVVDLGVSPLVPAQVATATIDVPAHGASVLELTWTVAGLAADARAALLVVSDVTGGAEIAVPPGIPDLAGLDSFVAPEPGVAYRIVRVG